MKTILYAFFACLLLIFTSSCKFLRNSGGNNKSNLDTVIVVKRDTPKTNKEPLVIKIDTLRYCDTSPAQNNFRTVICYESVYGKVIKKDTIAKIRVRDSSKNVVNIDSSNKNPIKAAYNVAIVMPFMSGGTNKNGETESKSIRALEFYEGVQMAYDSLRRENINLFISVFDSKDSDSVLQTLLIKEELLKADLIIGPMAGAELRTMSAFAQNYKKTIISPLNPKEISAEDNPYFIQFSPTARMQARNILKYLETAPFRRSKNIVLVGTREDSLAMEQFQEEYGIYRRDPNQRVNQYMSVEGKFSSDAFRAQIKRGQTNIIVVLSNRENFVTNLTSHLHQSIGWQVGEVSTQEDYILFGQSQWKYFEGVNAEQFESTRLHLVTDCFADLKEPNIVRFKEAYFAKYGMPPREFAYIGFDLMLYFGRMLKKYGTDFRNHLHKEPYKGRHNTIKIEALMRERKVMKATEIQTETVINRYENSAVNIIKFEQFNFTKVY